jgi:Ty3 transposon capsid-like protein/Zinc knuckle
MPNTRSKSRQPLTEVDLFGQNSMSSDEKQKNVKNEEIHEGEMNIPSLIVNSQNTNIESTTMNASQSAISSVKKFRNSQLDDAMLFLKTFEKAMLVAKIRDSEIKIHWFGTRLAEEAREWFQDYYLLDEDNNWDKCKDEFLSIFKKKVDRSVDLLIEMAEIKQKTWIGESVESYSICIRKLYNQYNVQPEVIPMSEKQKITYFIKGINPDLIESLKMKFASRDGYSKSATFSEVLEYALFIEENAQISMEAAEKNAIMEERTTQESHPLHIGAVAVERVEKNSVKQFFRPRKGRTLIEVDKELMELKNSVESFQTQNQQHVERMNFFTASMNAAVKHLTDSVKELNGKWEYNRTAIQSQESASPLPPFQPWPSKFKRPYYKTRMPTCYSCGELGHISPRCNASEEKKKAYKENWNSIHDGVSTGVGGNAQHGQSDQNFRRVHQHLL